MKWRIEEIPDLKGYIVEWAEPGNYFLSRRNRVFQSVNLVQPFELIAEIDAPAWKRVVSHSRLGQRLLRFAVTNVIPLKNGDIFVAFDKSIGLVQNGKYMPLQGMHRPCRILRSAVATHESGSLFFGEYLANNKRGEMHVYKYVPGSDRVEIVHTFQPNSIRHIHGIYSDPFDQSLICLTGDAGSECRIIRTRDEFGTIEIVGHGDETWRAVSILFSAESMYYGMDAEFRSNNIYRLSRSNGERQPLGEVNGTVFYSQQFAGEMFFATTAENAPNQKENVAAIWCIDRQRKLKEVAKFEKDRWHPTFFGFGTVYFPHIASVSKHLFFSLAATARDDHTFRIFSND